PGLEVEAPTTEIDEPIELDDLELPEFGEEDALAEMAAEPELEVEAPTAEIDESTGLDDSELPELNVEQALAEATEEPIEFDELDLPEYNEEDALGDVEPTSDESAQDDFELEPVELPELSEIPSENVSPAVEESDLAHQDYDEKAFDELLSEEEQEQTPSFSFDAPLDTTTTDSAGMDIGAMLEMGEDWNGFSLSPEQQASISDDIPDDQADIWSQDNVPEQAQILDENWEDQPDLEDFNPKENSYRTIDELMAEVESEEEQEIDDELKLDVGLNDFPDVIGDIGDATDIDANAEAAGKLDLAKIYVEMNDSQGAIKLLEEAIVDGTDEIRREAKNLIDAINNS
ncbi:FimV/HubP family polar landmark protein, partial [Vibrio sp. M260118]|uniref:FimV/HubP family polar landmark protein n=1 Tax=Vibrio sp. M260118 TaxID=3020896 RepID=UPI002F3F0C35